MLAALAGLVLVPVTYVPANTRVLILPSVDASGDKNATTSAAEIAEADAETINDFTNRGFVVVSGADAATALTTAAVDLTVKANRTSDNLYKVGTAANARLVAFTMVEKTGSKLKEHLMSSHVEGYVGLRTWLLDVQDKHAFLADAKKDADSTKVDAKEKSREVRAVRMAIDEQLHDFLKPYPALKK